MSLMSLDYILQINFFIVFNKLTSIKSKTYFITLILEQCKILAKGSIPESQQKYQAWGIFLV